MSEDSRVFSAVEKLETAVDRLLTRVEALETKTAMAGKPSWQSIGAAVGIMLGLLTPISWAIMSATETRVLRSEMILEKRLAPLETKLGLVIALRAP